MLLSLYEAVCPVEAVQFLSPLSLPCLFFFLLLDKLIGRVFFKKIPINAVVNPQFTPLWAQNIRLNVASVSTAVASTLLLCQAHPQRASGSLKHSFKTGRSPPAQPLVTVVTTPP